MATRASRAVVCSISAAISSAFPSAGCRRLSLFVHLPLRAEMLRKVPGQTGAAIGRGRRRVQQQTSHDIKRRARRRCREMIFSACSAFSALIVPGIIRRHRVRIDEPILPDAVPREQASSSCRDHSISCSARESRLPNLVSLW